MKSNDLRELSLDEIDAVSGAAVDLHLGPIRIVSDPDIGIVLGIAIGQGPAAPCGWLAGDGFGAHAGPFHT